MEPHTVDDVDTAGIDPIILEAADWLIRMESPSQSDNAAFMKWIVRSQRHIEEFFQMLAISQDLKEYEPPDTDPDGTELFPDVCTAVLEALEQPGQSVRELYTRYRMPLLHTLASRNIERPAALRLLRKIFHEAFRATAGTDVITFGRRLHEVAIEMAKAYREERPGLADEPSLDSLIAASNESLCIAERCDEETLFKSFRALKRCLKRQHRSEVLVRFYVLKESRASICRSLNINTTGFEEILWSSRRTFDEILRRQGVEMEPLQSCCYRETHIAALYVADAMDDVRKQEFELEMIDNAHYTREVDFWYTVKNHLKGQYGANAEA